MKIILIGILFFSFSSKGFAEGGRQKTLEKLPKSLFLIKRAKINADVSGPQFYPAEAQLRTISNDANMHNFKKFE